MGCARGIPRCRGTHKGKRQVRGEVLHTGSLAAVSRAHGNGLATEQGRYGARPGHAVRAAGTGISRILAGQVAAIDRPDRAIGIGAESGGAGDVNVHLRLRSGSGKQSAEGDEC